MTLDSLLKETLREWAEEAEVPQGLADRALRGRTRRRTLRLSTAMGVVALATAGTLLGVQAVVTDSVRPAPLPLSRPGMGGEDLRTDTESAPPKRFVAAGQVALSAYYITKAQGAAEGEMPRSITRTWYLYDSTTGTYRRTPWAYLDVAPGLRLAAVLEGPLPASRVGIVDTAGGKVLRWVEVRPGAAGLAWSPGGDRILVTHYTDNPDENLLPFGGPPGQEPEPAGDNGRTGYSVIDVRTSKVAFHRLPADQNNINYRQDLGWSRDGKRIWAPTTTVPSRIYYEIGGGRTEGEPVSDQEAGVSPNGRYLAGYLEQKMPRATVELPPSRGGGHSAGTVRRETPQGGEPAGPQVAVTETATGRRVAILPVMRLVAWADDEHLIGLGCVSTECRGKDEFHNRYVLIDIAGKEIVPLTGFQRTDRTGSWRPVLTRR